MRRRIMELGVILALVCLGVVYVRGWTAISQAPSDSPQVAPRPVRGERPTDMFQDWRELEIDGLRMTMDAEQVEGVAGKPAKLGRVHFVNRTYERWIWDDQRQVVLVTIDGEKTAKLDFIEGHSLSVGGKTVLRRGDSEAMARDVLPGGLSIDWGRDVKTEYCLSLYVDLKDAKVSGFRLDVPVAGPIVPVAGDGCPPLPESQPR